MDATEPPTALPAGLVLVRTTPLFDDDTVPAGLLDSHQVAAGVRVAVEFHDEPTDTSSELESTGLQPPDLL